MNNETTEEKSIQQKVEESLAAKQSSKEFKDVGKVAQTKKEKSAYRLISGQMLRDLELDGVMAYNMVKKEAVWPEINIQQERERGVSSGAVYLKVKIREGAPSRPKDDKNKRATYVLFLEKLQNDLIECYNVTQIKELSEKYRVLPFNEVIGMFLNPDFLTSSEEEKIRIEEELKKNVNMRIAMMHSRSGLVTKLVNEVFGAKFENILFNKSDSSSATWYEAYNKEVISAEMSHVLIEKLKEREEKFIEANNKNIEDYKNMSRAELVKAMETNWTIGSENKKLYKLDMEKFRSWAITYYERKIRNEIEVYKKKTEAALEKPEDWSWFDVPKTKESAEEKIRAKSINTKKPLSYIKRIGGYKIENNSPEQIVKQFGFGAVNYGNYVDDKWSKEHTNHFLGAISDMAEMLNINIKQINQLGNLGIAFGAKGRPGHLATYFPQTKDINLTKSNGDGSVAHEWGHYFDNVIVEHSVKKATNNFASEGSCPDSEIRNAFKDLMEFIRKGSIEYTPLLPVKFYSKQIADAPSYSKHEGGRWVNKTVEIKGTIEETLAEVSDMAIINTDYYKRQVRVFGYIINSFGLDEYDVPMKIRTSYYFHKSAYNVFRYCTNTEETEARIEVRSKYWTSDVELFARAWETVVLKKLLDKNRLSNYLVSDIPTEDVVLESWTEPYPAGKELERIELLIDNIILLVKQKMNITNFVPPSAIREDEYIELSSKNDGKSDAAMVIEKSQNAAPIVEFIDNTNEPALSASTTQDEILVIDEEGYLAINGVGRNTMGDSALHKNKGNNSDKSWSKLVEMQAEKDRAIMRKRELLRIEYNAKVENGEIRPPSRQEKLIATANGQEDNESVQAARRILEKNGVDWKIKQENMSDTGESCEIGQTEASNSNVVDGKYIQSISVVNKSFDSAFKVKEYLETISGQDKSMYPSVGQKTLGLSFDIPAWIMDEGVKLWFNYEEGSDCPYQFITIEQETKNTNENTMETIEQLESSNNKIEDGKHFLKRSDLHLPEQAPFIEVGTVFHSIDNTETWTVDHFTELGIVFKHQPKSPLSTKIEDRFLSYPEIIELLNTSKIHISDIDNNTVSLSIALIEHNIKVKKMQTDIDKLAEELLLSKEEVNNQKNEIVVLLSEIESLNSIKQDLFTQLIEKDSIIENYQIAEQKRIEEEQKRQQELEEAESLRLKNIQDEHQSIRDAIESMQTLFEFETDKKEKKSIKEAIEALELIA